MVVAEFFRCGVGASRGRATCGVAGSEPSIGTRDRIQSPGQTFGILVLEMRSLIWMQEKFKEVCYLALAFVLGAGNQAKGSYRLLGFPLDVGIDWLQR